MTGARTFVPIVGFIVKIDTNGNSLWSDFVFGGINSDIGVDPNGNAYVAGRGHAPVFDQMYVIKDGPDGTRLWTQVQDTPSPPIEPHVVVGDQQNVFVGAGGTAFLILDYDSDGNLLGMGQYQQPGATDHAVMGMKLDGSLNAYLTGKAHLGSVDQALTVKFDSQEAEVWAITYTGPGGNAAASGIALDDLPNVYITGSSDGIGTGQDYTTIKYSQ